MHFNRYKYMSSSFFVPSSVPVTVHAKFTRASRVDRLTLRPELFGGSGYIEVLGVPMFVVPAR